ncbi:hypothetical protein ONZ45_g3751 [Pleurotus djamor]|nr:hypothetical protein ONZ45_g3751 [Pleurotus djamor]
MTPYARVAKPEELNAICDVFFRAFQSDPTFNYYGTVKNAEAATGPKVRKNVRRFVTMLTKLCHIIGGRITVAVSPDENNKETIGAAALWYPPNVRPALWRVTAQIRAGAIPLLRGWGYNGLKRLGFQYMDQCHRAYERCFKAKGIKDSPDNSWYLSLVATDPEHQGKGLMSLLIREAFAHAPGAKFVLEASTPKSKVQYAHLGFETLEDVRLGKGLVSDLGFPAATDEAVGVPIAVMAKFPSPDQEANSPPS